MTGEFVEVVTRAVVERSQRRVSWRAQVPAEGVEAVLGVHIGESELQIIYGNGQPVAEIEAEGDLWCSDDEGSRVIRLPLEHTEALVLALPENVVGDPEVLARFSRPVRCTAVRVTDGQFTLDLEAEVELEVIALARLWVLTGDEALLEELDDEDELGDAELSDDATGDYTGDDSGDSTGDATGDASGDATGGATGDASGDATGELTDEDWDDWSVAATGSASRAEIAGVTDFSSSPPLTSLAATETGAPLLLEPETLVPSRFLSARELLSKAEPRSKLFKFQTRARRPS